MLKNKGPFIKGVMLIVSLSLVALFISQIPFVKSLSLSPLIVGIIIGMIYGNTLRKRLPDQWVPGILFCSKQILRGAIIFYGFRLTFQHIVAVGPAAIVVDIIMVLSVLLVGYFTGRMLKLDPHISTLTTAGSAICGAAAVLGTEPVLKNQPHKTAIAVSTVVIFGTISMFLYPVMYKMGWLNLNPQQMGIYIGSTIHEVAHVVGAGNALNDTVIAESAVIVKMIRVILLAPFLLILSLLVGRKNRKEGIETSGKSKITIPWFAFGFLIVIGFNSLNLLPEAVVDGINTADDFALTMAMTALGVETNFKKFKQSGLKPFILAFVLFIWLVVGGYFISSLVQF
ncbi:MAG: YeiH family protein [Fermentimonas sp.]|jgi:uncharacterized integral membrane protein (TIGR00698 family)|nr:YeiH family protein [Fermentimonas sp.]